MSTEQDESCLIMLQMLEFDQLKLKLDDFIIDNFHIQYRGEGNENLVLSLPEMKFVFRLHKNHSNEVIDTTKEKEKLKIYLMYYYNLMKPFFSDRYLTLPIIGEISETFVKLLDEKLFSERPEHRKNKQIIFGGLEIHPDYTFLPQYARFQFLENCPLPNQDMENEFLRKAFPRDYLNLRNYVHSLLTNVDFVKDLNRKEKDSARSTLSIEIKPKQAWTAELYRRFDVCAFCMNQYFKLGERKIENKSEYCPLNLFSGIESRMHQALKELLASPQNNLKIFKDGDLVFGEKMCNDVEYILSDWFFKSQDDEGIKRCKDHFCKLLIEILKSDFSNDQEVTSFKTEPYFSSNQYKICSDEDAEKINKAFRDSNLKCDYISSSLPKNCILSRIMELQKLDEIGLEEVYDFYKTRLKKHEDEFSHINNLISRVTFQCGDVRMPILNVAEAYTLSAAGKDLSIIIAVQIIPSDTHPTSEQVVEIDNFKYEFSISVVDIGPKPISCIKKHWKRDGKILQSCLNYFYSSLKV